MTPGRARLGRAVVAAALVCLPARARAGLTATGTPPRMGSRVTCLAVHPARPEVLLVGTDDGLIVRSDDGGISWLDVPLMERRDVFYGRIRSPDSRVETTFGWGGPNPHFHFFLRERGLKPFKTNIGQTLMSLVPPGTAINALTFDRGDPTRVWAGTSVGLFKSRDGGRTFSRAFVPGADNEQHEVRAVAVDPQDSRKVFVGTWFGLYQSTDGGLTFRKPKDEYLAEVTIHGLVFDPTEPGKLYAATAGSLSISPDGGQQWVTSYVDDDPEAGEVTSVLPLEGGLIWITTRDGVRASEKGGEPGSWIRTTDELGKRALRGIVALGAPDEVLVFGDDAIWYSRGGGRIFRPIFQATGREQITGGARMVTADGRAGAWVATTSGVYRYHASGAPPGLDRPLPTFSGPSLWELRKAVYRAQHLDPVYANGKREAVSRYKVLIPRVKVSLNFDDSDDALLIDDRLFPTLAFRNFVSRAEKDFEWEATATWNLSALVFNREMLSGWGRIERDVKAVRDQIDDNLTRAYLEWQQVSRRAALESGGETDRDRIAYQLKIEELEAYLDGLSQGYFSAQRRAQRPSARTSRSDP